MPACFVTGTGTDIGKSFVTASLLTRARTATGLKPVASGFDRGAAAASDPGILLAAMRRPISDATLDDIAPWRFAAPLSPDMAAAREGRMIDFAALIAFCRARIAAASDLLLIEGVGGIMVPLDDTHTVLDWMAWLDIPVLLVAGSYLGTISHTLSAVSVLKTRGLKIASLVVNETEGSTVPLDETAATIQRFVPRVPVVALPRGAAPDHPTFTAIAERLGC